MLPTQNSVKDENGDLLANPDILNKWKNYYSVIEST
jgi:hypothetical protein